MSTPEETSSPQEADNVYPENVSPIRDEMMFVFPEEIPVPENGPYVVEIGTWLEGDPKIVRVIPGFDTKTLGIERLRNIGHSWDYNVNYVGRLYDKDGKEVARLNIYHITYGVVDLEKEPGE